MLARTRHLVLLAATALAAPVVPCTAEPEPTEPPLLGEIRGYVFDDEDKPVAGASVEVDAEDDPEFSDSWRGPDEALIDALEAAGREPVPAVARATTAVDGA